MVQTVFRKTARSKFYCFFCGILLALFASLAFSMMMTQPVYAESSSASSTTAVTVLPFVTITDRAVPVSYRWWAPTSSAQSSKLIEIQNDLHDALLAQFQKMSVSFIAHPAKPSASVAPTLSALAKQAKATLVIKGDVRKWPPQASGLYPVTLKLQVVSPSSPDRVLAEVVRKFSVDQAKPEFAKLSKDFAGQIRVVIEKGLGTTQPLLLAVRSPLSFSQQTEFKAAFLKTMTDVRDMKERRFEKGRTIYDVEYSGDPSQFGARLQSLKLNGFNLKSVKSAKREDVFGLDVRAID